MTASDVSADVGAGGSGLSLATSPMQTPEMALPFDQRYAVVSEGFPEWLSAEPIRLPKDHSTYGWGCRVAGCMTPLGGDGKNHLCVSHRRKFNASGPAVDLDTFVQQAVPSGFRRDWALHRNPPCRICGPVREQFCGGYCSTHFSARGTALRRGKTEEEWRAGEGTYGPLPICGVRGCVHDGVLNSTTNREPFRVCGSHHAVWMKFLAASDLPRDSAAWAQWSASPELARGFESPASEGLVETAHLPVRLQCEIRYAMHRYASLPRRAQTRPRALREAVAALASSGATTLSDPILAEVVEQINYDPARRALNNLIGAARSLIVGEAEAKAAGLFDPVLVGATPFPDGTGKPTRRKYWDLTDITQLWLRDLLWDHLRFLALEAAGKRLSAGSVHQRIGSIRLLSKALQQLRDDQGDDPSTMGSDDAKAFKELWDLWYREQTPVVRRGQSKPPRWAHLSEPMLSTCTAHMKEVLTFGRRRNIIDKWADSFLMAFPQYRREHSSPHPRPLSDEHFRRLVSDDALAVLDDSDISGLGLCDIWLAHAYQGGRIGEVLNLRLGCIGLIGNAQPYLWRDISKTGRVDYGMPCYLPVFDRLQRRQEITRTKLRRRYAKQLAELNDDERIALEQSWDKTMPLFPSSVSNPDLLLALSKNHFRDIFSKWIVKIGLDGVTTRRTRVTLATALLNNGAPPALVRQMLGHYSEAALAHYAQYNDQALLRNLQQVWAAGPGMAAPGTLLMTPDTTMTTAAKAALGERIDLTVVPVEHGLCRYGPVVGGSNCPAKKNCSSGPAGPCPHFVITGADLNYWQRKRDAAYHFAEGAPSEEAREYILKEWKPWETILHNLRDALGELDLLQAAEQLDLRSPLHDFFHPVFTTGWALATDALASFDDQTLTA